jgi:hypothetical protein
MLMTPMQRLQMQRIDVEHTALVAVSGQPATGRRADATERCHRSLIRNMARAYSPD